MSDKKRVWSEKGEWTEDGRRVAVKLEHRLKNMLTELVSEGYSAVEAELLLAQAVTVAGMEYRLDLKFSRTPGW